MLKKKLHTKKLLTIFAALGSLLFLASCQTKVPDVPICKDFGASGYCLFTVSNVEFVVDNGNQRWPYPDKNGRRAKWSEIKNNSVIVPIDSYAQISVYMLTQCRKNNNCVNEAEPKMTEKVSRFNRNANFAAE